MGEETLDTLVLAFDLGTDEAGWVLVDAEHKIIKCAMWSVRKEGSLNKRLAELYEWLDSAVWAALDEAFMSQPRGTTITAVEMPHIRYVRAAKALFQALGMLKGIVYCLGDVGLGLSDELIEITPAEAKVALTGRGNASKKMVLDMARKLSGCKELNQHQSDAYGVACAAWGRLHQKMMLEMAKEESDE